MAHEFLSGPYTRARRQEQRRCCSAERMPADILDNPRSCRRWYQRPGDSLRFDTRGTVLGSGESGPNRGTGSITIGNKTIAHAKNQGLINNPKIAQA